MNTNPSFSNKSAFALKKYGFFRFLVYLGSYVVFFTSLMLFSTAAWASNYERFGNALYSSAKKTGDDFVYGEVVSKDDDDTFLNFYDGALNEAGPDLSGQFDSFFYVQSESSGYKPVEIPFREGAYYPSALFFTPWNFSKHNSGIKIITTKTDVSETLKQNEVYLTKGLATRALRDLFGNDYLQFTYNDLVGKTLKANAKRSYLPETARSSVSLLIKGVVDVSNAIFKKGSFFDEDFILQFYYFNNNSFYSKMKFSFFLSGPRTHFVNPITFVESTVFSLNGKDVKYGSFYYNVVNKQPKNGSYQQIKNDYLKASSDSGHALEMVSVLAFVVGVFGIVFSSFFSSSFYRTNKTQKRFLSFACSVFGFFFSYWSLTLLSNVNPGIFPSAISSVSLTLSIFSMILSLILSNLFSAPKGVYKFFRRGTLKLFRLPGIQEKEIHI